jgi:hypothetical protein
VAIISFLSPETPSAIPLDGMFAANENASVLPHAMSAMEIYKHHFPRVERSGY